MLKSASLTLAAILIGLPAAAQDHLGFEDRLVASKFAIDFVPFKDSLSDSVIVEVYYKAFSYALSYQKWGDKFKASYEINIVINKKKKQVTGITRDGDLFADSYEMTISPKDFIIDKFEFRLSPDDYELVGKLVDTHSGDELTAREEMKLKDFGKNIPFLSGLEFVRESTRSDEKSRFERNAVVMIPSVSRTFGFDDPLLKIYYEIYNRPDYDKDYLVYYEIYLDKTSVKSDTTLLPSKGAVTARLEEFNIESLLPGIYSITVNVGSPGGELDLAAESPFVVEWSVMGIVRNDFKTAVEQLRYIATKKEMDDLKSSPAEKRLEFWIAFWIANDPSPGTPENELRDEYYKRLRYADLNFGHFGRDGWKSDMGMVYITYGAPDEIERHPFDTNAKPYQLWYYYEQKKRFLFVDINGYGDFELQYPYDGDITKGR